MKNLIMILALLFCFAVPVTVNADEKTNDAIETNFRTDFKLVTSVWSLLSSGAYPDFVDVIGPQRTAFLRADMIRYVAEINADEWARNGLEGALGTELYLYTRDGSTLKAYYPWLYDTYAEIRTWLLSTNRFIELHCAGICDGGTTQPGEYVGQPFMFNAAHIQAIGPGDATGGYEAKISYNRPGSYGNYSPLALLYVQESMQEIFSKLSRLD